MNQHIVETVRTLLFYLLRQILIKHQRTPQYGGVPVLIKVFHHSAIPISFQFFSIKFSFSFKFSYIKGKVFFCCISVLSNFPLLFHFLFCKYFFLKLLAKLERGVLDYVSIFLVHMLLVRQLSAGHQCKWTFVLIDYHIYM